MGEVLVQCSGPVYGLSPSFYRAEAYGVLSATLLIQRLLSYHKVTDHQPYVHHCDNQSVVKHAKHCQDHDGWYPNDTLKSDWDVLQQLTEAFKTATKAPSVEWVRAHQDDHRPYDELPLESQLNCQADELANVYMKQLTADADLSRVPRFPVNKAQFHMPQGTCTYKLARVIRNARTTPPLLEKMLRDNPTWDEDTHELINWKAHSRALNRHEAKKVTIIKYLHNILPVGSLVHRYDPKYKDECPTCGAPDEDQLHLTRCPDPTRQVWRATTLCATRKKLEKLGTDPVIIDIVLDGISSHFEDTLLCPNHYPDNYWLLVASQNQIGWDNFLKGRLSQEFATLSQRTTKNNGITWTTTLSAFVLAQWLLLWTQRNEDRHGKDKEEQSEARLEQLYREVELLYSRADEAPTRVNDTIFRCDLETQLQKKHAELVAWLANWLPVVEAETRRTRQNQTPSHTQP